MNVGILTFHGSSNPGAFWQAYATCQLVRDLGHVPTVIDYRTPLRQLATNYLAALQARR